MVFILNFSCEMQKFRSVVTWKFERSYPLVFENTTDIEPMVITRQTVLNTVGLPDDARVTRVAVEGITAYVTEEPTSAANSILLTGVLTLPNGSLLPLYRNVPLNLASITIINQLIKNNITTFTNEVEKILKNENDTRRLEIDMQATADGTARINLVVNIHVGIEYEYCREVPMLLGPEGKECDLD
jgi:hypothetical protein